MPDALTALARGCEAIPYHRLLGIVVDDLSPARAVVRLPHRALTANRNGTLHGGVSASLADVAGTLAARAAAGTAAPGYAADLVLSFLAPTKAPAVIADARVLRRGRELVHVDVDVRDGSGGPVLKGLVVYRVATLAPADAPAPGPPFPDCDFPAHRAGVSSSPFTAHLGLTTVRPGRGRSAVLLPWQERLADEAGSVHEGAVASLVDSAGGVASWALDGFDVRGRAWTVGMHLHFHGPERREDLVALGESRGRHHGLHFNAVTIYARQTGAVVASGTITFQIARRPA